MTIRSGTILVAEEGADGAVTLKTFESRIPAVSFRSGAELLAALEISLSLAERLNSSLQRLHAWEPQS